MQTEPTFGMSTVTAEAEAVIPAVVRLAADRGSPPAAMADLLVRAFDEAYPARDRTVQVARFVVAGRVGRLELLSEEGGCVPSTGAAALYLGHHPSKKPNPETVRKAARENRLIAIRDGHGEILFPAWQFASSGGALGGLAAVLKELSQRPGYSEITPFVFFLQHHARTAGRPLDALREGRIDDVVAAAIAARD